MKLETISGLQPGGTNVPGRRVSVFELHQPHKLSHISESSVLSSTDNLRKESPHEVDHISQSAEPQPEHKNLFDVHQGVASLTPEKFEEVPVVSPLSPGSDVKSLAPSALSLPIEDIPKRKSSMSAMNWTLLDSHLKTPQNLDKRGQEEGPGRNLRHTNSPVRDALEKGAQSSETLERLPCRTFVRTPVPLYLLDDDHASNPRVAMSIRLTSPIFVGGGTVDGQIELKVDAKSSKRIRSRPLLISRLSVDVIGVEEIEQRKRNIFLALATELFDSTHPPPQVLLRSQIPEKPAKGSELYWQTQPATVVVPFSIQLPLKTGPPPYSTRQASIRYVLCPSVVIKIGDTRSAIRQTWTIQVLPVHDPEKALVSLSSPLLATDTLTLSHLSAASSVKLTAGLHRQTWVSGGVLFTDVHVVNNTEKVLQKIDLQLEKSVLWFLHPAAGTSTKLASHLRLPSKINTQVVCKSTLKRGRQWCGIVPQGAELRTCELEIPRAHVTIGNGRYFEVRYFVKVTVAVSRHKSVSVQLPVTLIHINSLDVVPNSAMQVADSIEAKRSLAAVSRMANRALHKPYTQGQAFVNVLRQPLAHQQKHVTAIKHDDLRDLTEAVDKSPRRMTAKIGTAVHRVSCELNENCRPKRLSCNRHLCSRPSCYHCHLLYTEHAAQSDVETGPKLPRLQVSTSGLGFTESEFELPPDSPLRKVMLSEKERQMINQQREIRIRQQWSQHKSRKSSCSVEQKTHDMPTQGGRDHSVVPPKAAFDGLKPLRIERLSGFDRRPIQRAVSGVSGRPNDLPQSRAMRNRGRVSMERKRASFNDSLPAGRMTNSTHRGIRSMDWNDRTTS